MILEYILINSNIIRHFCQLVVHTYYFYYRLYLTIAFISFFHKKKITNECNQNLYLKHYTSNGSNVAVPVVNV